MINGRCKDELLKFYFNSKGLSSSVIESYLCFITDKQQTTLDLAAAWGLLEDFFDTYEVRFHISLNKITAGMHEGEKGWVVRQNGCIMSHPDAKGKLYWGSRYEARKHAVFIANERINKTLEDRDE